MRPIVTLLQTQDLYGSGSSVSTQDISSSQGLSLLTVSLITIMSVIFLSLIFYTVIYFWRNKNHEKKVIQDWKNRVFLEISVPHESAEDSQKEGENRDQKEIVGIGEQIFIVMTEYAKKGIKNWLFGTERFSLEIINTDQKIKFLIVCTTKTADVLERQIISTYPRADIIRHKNFDFFKENSTSKVQEMKLEHGFVLPFRTYKIMEKDPLNVLSNSLAGLEQDESAAIQIILSPVNNKTWQKKSRDLALKIQQGQAPESVMKKAIKFNLTNNTFFGLIGYFFKAIIRDIFDVILRIFGGKMDKDSQEKHKDEREIDLTGKKQAIQLTPQQQEMIKKLEEKASRPGFLTTIRIVSAAFTAERAEQIVETIVPAFQIFDIRPFNGIVKKKKFDPKKSLFNFSIRAPAMDSQDILNTEELNSLWHIPNYLVANSSINWLPSRRPPLPINIPGAENGNVHIGRAKSGMVEKEVYMKQEDRFRHLYTIGGSGSGKSVFMTNLILQDITNGNGVCVVDPHGETVDDVLLRIPKERKDDVIIFSPAFTDRPLGLNMLSYDRSKPTERTIVIDTLFQIWDKLYDLKATGGPMFENYMKNAMRLVMSHEASGSTLMEISKVLADEDYRTFKLAMCDEQQVVDFWEKEAQKAGGDASLENMVPYITSKLAPFVNNDFIRPMIGQQKSAINFREAMDNKKIILVKLEKGMIGETSAYLIGMVVIGNLLMAGMGRNDGLKYNLDGTKTQILPNERPPFFVYIDEMQNFLFDAIPKALEEIRKYKVGFVLAHQFVKQVIKNGDERIKDSIMANCASKFIFRCGAEDAEYLAKEFAPTLTPSDLQNPARFTCNSIVLIDGQKTTPFNIAPPPLSSSIDVEFKNQLIEETKQKYGKTLEEVEKDMRDRVEKFMF